MKRREVPRFSKLCEYVDLFGVEGGFEAILDILKERHSELELVV